MTKRKKNLFSTVLGFSRRISEDHVAAYAAQSAYFILMSIIPILLLMLTMIRYLPITQEDLTNMFFAIVPEAFQGSPIVLLTACLMAIAFFGFSSLK